MSKGETPSEMNLRHMLSLVLHQDPSTDFSIHENVDAFTKRAVPLSPNDNVNQDILTRLIKIEDPTLVVKIAGVTFNVNMEVLETYSDYFKENNESKLLELPEEHVSQTAFITLYEWMISDKPSLPRKGAIELYKAALYLKIPQLLAQFWKCLSNPIIVEENAFLFYLEALAFEAPQVRHAMLGRISRFFLYIVACEEFLHLPISDLCILFRSDLLSVNAELEIYFACVRYFNFDWESRSEQLLEVMKTIRLDFLPTEFVLELLNHESCIDSSKVMRLMYHAELQDHLRDLINYHCLSAFPGPNMVSIKKSNHRNWIFDACCEYHDKQQVRTVVPPYVPYARFCKYLKIICKAASKHWEDFQDIKISYDSSSSDDDQKWLIMESD